MTKVSLLNIVHQGPEFCRSLLPTTEHPDLYAALICGTPLRDGEAVRLFLDTGLIHIMVVSGAHLLFLERRLAWVPAGVRLLALGGYCWLTGFGAPVVKAFTRRVLEVPLRARGWSTLQCESAAVILLLALIPGWLFSRSFLMSWMCALAFTLPTVLPVFDRPLKVYVLLFAFAAVSPLTVLWNALLAPVIGDVLFPLCLAVVPFPFLVPAVDLVWDAFLALLAAGPHARPLEWFLPAKQLFWLPLFVHLGLLWWEVNWRRARAFASV